jgi:GT2 family glycosyltransferase
MAPDKLTGAGGSSPVSVLIVNYHAYDELSVCLDSLNARGTDAVEIVVVDHASNATALDLLVQRFPEVCWLAGESNPGFAAGVNRAAESAHGRYLLLLNPDCVVDQDLCGVLSAWLDAHPAVGVAGPLIRDADGTIQASARRFPGLTTGFAGRTSWLTRAVPGNPFSRRNLLTGPEVTAPMMVDWVSGACMLVRRSAFDVVGGMDENFFLYWEDADLCARVAAAGWRTAYNPTVGVTHLCGRSSRASPRSVRAFHRSALRYFLKHGGWVARIAAPLVFAALQTRAALVLLRRRPRAR